MIVGDCLHSRVVRSNVDLLSTLGAEVVLVAPPTLMPTGVENWPVRVSYTMDSEIADADVVMMLRVQQERMQGGFFPSHREYAALYGMSKERESRMKDSAIIMHPGPMLRGMEINYTVADAPPHGSVAAGIQWGARAHGGPVHPHRQHRQPRLLGENFP